MIKMNRGRVGWLRKLGWAVFGVWAIGCAAQVVPAAIGAEEEQGVSIAYGVKVGGEALKVEQARCSAAPINTRWPGHQRPKYQTELTAFARFTFTGPVQVEVVAPRDFKTVVVRPQSKGVKPQVDGRRITFTLAKPGGYSLELDDQHYNLHLFADPPMDYKVDRNDPKVRWFGPGEHDVGVITMKSGETLYLDEGAVVYGRVFARDADDISILGRGILDASRVKEVYIRNDPAKDKEEWEKGFAVANVERFDTIRLEFCDRVKIDGITIRDSQIYNIRPIGCRDLEIGWTKTLGNWRYNSDGFDMHNCEHVRIHDCFIRTYDDVVCVKGWDCWMDESEMLHDGYRHDVFKDVVVERCVMWNDWGKACEVGAETRAREIFDVTYRDIDVLHPNAYACDITNVDYADVHDVLFEDIRVEYDPIFRPGIIQKHEGEVWHDPSGGKSPGVLLGLFVLSHPEYSAGGNRRGRTRNVTFRNIRASGGKLPVSVFSGWSEKANVSGVKIEGLFFDGRPLRNKEEANLHCEKFVEEPEFARPKPRKVMNIVNFVRQCEPRVKIDLVKPLAEEIWLNTHYGLKNTILMQYDALLDDELMKTALTADQTKTEYGVWFEVVKPLCEAIGLPWKGRNGWTWDWHVDPGFPMSYGIKDRERLCDELMRLATVKFGRCPESVGSWLLDAHTMTYLSEKYGVKAFCICREQDNTDAYGLRGGYFNGGYYPSKLNMLSAARDMKNAIRTPVFKMLTPDPIYNYSRPEEMFPDYRYGGCSTMEPVWYGGHVAPVVDWYFRVYAEPKAMLNFSYMQTGQENSMGWHDIALGLPYQIKKIAEYAAKHELVVETLGETGRHFMETYSENCPQTQVALEDWSGHGRNSVWYNSRCYRANLFLDGERLSFRDIHQMRDDFREPHFDTPCKSWKIEYFTPPVVDKYLDRAEKVAGDMAFDGAFAALEATAADEKTMVVTARRKDGTAARIVFSETGLTVEGATLDWTVRPERRRTTVVEANQAKFEFEGYRYAVTLKAEVKATSDGWRLEPRDGVIALEL